MLHTYKAKLLLRCSRLVGYRISKLGTGVNPSLTRLGREVLHTVPCVGINQPVQLQHGTGHERRCGLGEDKDTCGETETVRLFLAGAQIECRH
jgi:hypothetical protein